MSLQLRERYFIEKTRRKWWDERSQCPKPSQSKTGKTHSLGLNNMAGVFIVLLGGVIISSILLVIEIRCKKLVVNFTRSQVIISAVGTMPSSETQGVPAGTMQLIFLGESLLQELKSPWELILTEPVPEVVEFRPADWAEKYFSAQSAMRSSRVTLSPSYTK